MPYEVAFDEQALRQRRALPLEEKAALGDALRNVAADPYPGTRYDPRHPPELRTMAFGEWGLLAYLVRERQQRVVVLDVTWAG